MNHKIKELVEQAFFETEYDDVQNLPETMERFAELIVRECADIADEPTSRPFDSYGKKIKKHFGVE